jgi:hypothetical protein
LLSTDQPPEYGRTIAAAGFRRMPTAPRSSMKVHSATIRLTTSSGVNIAAIVITSHGRYSAFSAYY